MDNQLSLFTANLASATPAFLPVLPGLPVPDNSNALGGIAPLIFDFGNEEAVEVNKPRSKPQSDPNVLTFLPGPKTHEEVIRAWQKLPPEIRHGRLRLTFVNPVSLTQNRRKGSKPSKVHEKRLFVGKESGRLCYTTTARTGFYFVDSEMERLIKIEPIIEEDVVEKVRKLANRFHPNAWHDLKEDLLADPARYAKNYGYTVTSITSKFPSYVIEDIKRAFEEKSDYSYEKSNWDRRRENSGRDLKVQCRTDGGIFKAWFTSEFPGCANGGYWILINPTTAAFKERD